MKQQVGGVVLAGGKSSRMGRDKAQLEIAGQSLLSRQFQILEQVVGHGNVLVSGQRPNFPSIQDEVDDLGPLEGVRCVVQHLMNSKQALLIIPVDMPKIGPLELNNLLFSASKGEAIKYKGLELPLLLTNLHKSFSILTKLCKVGEVPQKRSFKSLIAKHQVYEIEVSQMSYFVNTNTMEDWREAVSETSHTSTN